MLLATNAIVGLMGDHRIKPNVFASDFLLRFANGPNRLTYCGICKVSDDPRSSRLRKEHYHIVKPKLNIASGFLTLLEFLVKDTGWLTTYDLIDISLSRPFVWKVFRKFEPFGHHC